MTISITKLFEFEACHHLPNYDGACRNLHGHSYKLEVEIVGGIDEETGMITDFSNLKRVVQDRILNRLDHSNLNAFFDMPTAENMVKYIFEKMTECYSGVIRVRLWETSTSYAEIKK